jgi:RTX calcium-binding nonapeptide repeat (4 copies)
MFGILYEVVLMLVLISIFTSSFGNVFAIEMNSLGITTNGFSTDLKSKINELVANALNDTGSVVNSSSLLTNETNLTSSQVIISKNKVTSTINSNSSGDGNSITKDKVTTTNGVCSSIKIGGSGNDTLASSGHCNDELTGGRGADKFTCGEGNDTVRDYNSEEGDVILDRQNCEEIL